MSTLRKIAAEINTDNMHAYVQEWEGTGDRAYRLYCFDLMVNEWTEYYTDLATALLRFAVLVRCDQFNGGLAFNHNARDFVAGATYFFEKETSK